MPITVKKYPFKSLEHSKSILKGVGGTNHALKQGGKYKEQLWLTAGGCISDTEPWEARSAGVTANSVGTFCIHTDISALLTFIDIYKQEENSEIILGKTPERRLNRKQANRSSDSCNYLVPVSTSKQLHLVMWFSDGYCFPIDITTKNTSDW